MSDLSGKVTGMPYVESICRAGKTVEIERYYTARYGKRGQKRSERRKPTRDEQREINNRHAEKKLRRLINANFVPGDYHLVLSYAHPKGTDPRTPDEMKEDIRKFLRGIRKDCKLMESDLKYIHVPEIGKKGARHHHLVISKINPDIINRHWTHGFIHINPLDHSGNYAKLAAYLIKYANETIGTTEAITGKRWNSSRNLIHPEPKVKVITNREWYRTEPKIPNRFKGKYILDKSTVESGTISPEYGGFGYFRYTLIMRC